MSTQTRKRRGRESELVAAVAYRADGWPYAEAVGAGSPGRDITGTPGIANECKARTDLAFEEWLRQAERHASPGEIPHVIARLARQGAATVDTWASVVRWHVLRRLVTLANLSAGDVTLQVAARRGLDLHNWLTESGSLSPDTPLPVLAVQPTARQHVITDGRPCVTPFWRMRRLFRLAGYGDPPDSPPATEIPPDPARADAGTGATFDGWLPTPAGSDWLGCMACQAMAAEREPGGLAHAPRCPHNGQEIAA